MITVSGRVKADALVAKWPGIEVACVINSDGNTDITFGDGDKTVAEVEAAVAEYEAVKKAKAVQEEAERRIDAGLVLSSGVRFKCDDKSISRIHGMKDSTAFPVTFKTSAGVTVTINNATEATAVFNEAAAYVAAVLAASATLQDNPPADPQDDQHWPSENNT